MVLTDLEDEPKGDAFGVHLASDVASTEINPMDPLAGRWIRFWPWPLGSQKDDVHFDDAAANSEPVRVIVIDEVHNLLVGSPREQRVILQLFRHLSNELKASLVCLGIADAREAIAGDTQLARRLDQIVLPRWKADEEFQGLVVGVLRSLPLRRPSALSAQSLRILLAPRMGSPRRFLAC